MISTENTLKGYSNVELVFRRDMILLIEHTVDWELIRQRNKRQNNKENLCKKLKSQPQIKSWR